MPMQKKTCHARSFSTTHAGVRGSRNRISATAEKIRPMIRNVSVKFDRTNVMVVLTMSVI
jgi:hypothetical protein